jgi:hypothetical protein
MFEIGTQMGEYGNGGPPSRESEYPGYGQGEEEYPGYGQGEEEYPGYGQGEEEYPGYGQGEEEYPGLGQGEEEQFLPIIPAILSAVGPLLSNLLGGKREAESEYGGYGQGEDEYSQSETGQVGEAEEQFLLDKILPGLLGREAEYNTRPLTAEQEDRFAGRLLEVSDEEELARVLGGIVNTVGRAVQGISGAVNSPQGRAIIDAVGPLADAALRGEAAGSLMEAESGEVNQEAEQYEAARRVVQLASAAARDVATAPPGATPQLVGELAVIRAARHFARPLFRRALRVVSPFARRYYGQRYYGRRIHRGYWPGYRYRRPYSRRYYGYRRYRPRYGYGYPAYDYPPAIAPPVTPEPAPEPPPGPPQPGYRWVAVPIGAPVPPPEPAEPPPVTPPAAAPPPPMPPAPPEGAGGALPAGSGSPTQSEYGWRGRRRYGRYGRRHRRYGRYGRYGGGSGGGYGGGYGGGDQDDDDEFRPDGR